MAYRLIRERIQSATYVAGQRLVMDELARDLRMSQVPIREAVRRLEAEGWLTYRRNSGPEVASVSQEQWQTTMELLAVLDGYAAALAAPLLAPQDLAALGDLISTTVAAHARHDLKAYSTSVREFHATIYQRCPNQLVVECITETQLQLDAIHGTQSPTLPRRANAAIAEHRALLALLATEAPFQAVEAAARGHKLNFVRAASARIQDLKERQEDDLCSCCLIRHEAGPPPDAGAGGRARP
jgi:DNA-binding GntR family transcriptional regulator